MATPKDIYVRCDELELLPPLCRQNYEREAELIVQQLPQGATVLQVGSSDGVRATRLLQARPDLQLTGLEIDEPLVELARKNVADAGLNARFIVGDVTDPPELPQFDYVICLNNTLGYIPDWEAAIKQMRRLADQAIISVYGEKFTDDLAREYFAAIGLEIDRIDGDSFTLKDFTTVRRYTKQDVAKWGGELIETPVGYYCN